MSNYNLKELAKECISDLNAIGIYPNITENDFTVNNRAKSRYGQCKYTNVQYSYDVRTLKRKPISAKMSINISSFLLDDRNNINSVKETIYHELLHACNECIGEHHGGTWKEYAKRVSKAYNINITTTKSYSEALNSQVYNEAIKSKNKEYKNMCGYCGRISTKISARKPKWYDEDTIKNYYCNKCGKKSLGMLRIIK